jgi:hypothetical protein
MSIRLSAIVFCLVIDTASVALITGCAPKPHTQLRLQAASTSKQYDFFQQLEELRSHYFSMLDYERAEPNPYTHATLPSTGSLGDTRTQAMRKNG